MKRQKLKKREKKTGSAFPIVFMCILNFYIKNSAKQSENIKTLKEKKGKTLLFLRLAELEKLVYQ